MISGGGVGPRYSYAEKAILLRSPSATSLDAGTTTYPPSAERGDCVLLRATDDWLLRDFLRERFDILDGLSGTPGVRLRSLRRFASSRAE